MPTTARAANKTLRGHKLLVLASWPLPDDFRARVAARFPDLQVECRAQRWDGAPGLPAASLPADAWEGVTILLTFSTLPAGPAEAPALRYVQLMSAGANHVLDRPLFAETDDVAFCTANGVHG